MSGTFAAFFLALLQLAPVQSDELSRIEGMADLEFTLGAWEGATVQDDGEIYRVRLENESWLNGQVIQGDSFDARGEAAWSVFFRGMQTWNGLEERPVFRSAGRHGGIVDGYITMPEPGVIHQYWLLTGRNGQQMRGRDTWRFNDARDAFRWDFANYNAETGAFDIYFSIEMERAGSAESVVTP